MRRGLARYLMIFPLMAILLLSRAAGGVAQEEMAEEKSLYDRLGGVYSIATVVDDFIDRVLVNDTLNANPEVDAARKRVPEAGLKHRLTAMVCQATGGPEVYHGRDMKSSHAHLTITEKEWKALEADFKASLDHFEVPEKEQNELFAIVGSTKGDIVVESPTGAKADPKAIYPPESDTSLFGRLGGLYNIATVVDDFIERVLANDTLNANPAIKEARDRVPKAGLKFRVTALVCKVTGGPQAYHGRTMKDAHAHLNISEKEWEAMAADFKKSLDKFEVPEAEQKELFEIIGSTKADIVTAGK